MQAITMQVITTRYLPATNTLGSRIKAECFAGYVIIDYPHELEAEEAHRYAAHSLMLNLKWTNEFITGLDKKGDYQHVLISK